MVKILNISVANNATDLFDESFFASRNLTFSVNPSGHRIYIIYDSSLGNLDGNSGIQDVNSNNEPVGDNFSSTTEDGYKIYMTTNSDGEYSPFTLRVRFA